MKARLTMIFLLMLPAAASAHHILGIPHYKYSEEYPQVPFVEVMAQAGPHDLHFTYFPGTPRPGEAVRFKLYVRNRETGEPFREPMKMDVVQKTFLGRGVPLGTIDLRTGLGPESNDYKFFFSFDEPEAFEMTLAFPNGGAIERIPFPIQIGETDDRPMIGGAVLLLLLSVGSVRILKKRGVSA